MSGESPGEAEYDISPYRFELQHRHVFHQELVCVLDSLKPWQNRSAVKELHEALRP